MLKHLLIIKIWKVFDWQESSGIGILIIELFPRCGEGRRICYAKTDFGFGFGRERGGKGRDSLLR